MKSRCRSHRRKVLLKRARRLFDKGVRFIVEFNLLGEEGVNEYFVKTRMRIEAVKMGCSWRKCE